MPAIMHTSDLTRIVLHFLFTYKSDLLPHKTVCFFKDSCYCPSQAISSNSVDHTSGCRREELYSIAFSSSQHPILKEAAYVRWCSLFSILLQINHVQCYMIRTKQQTYLTRIHRSILCPRLQLCQSINNPRHILWWSFVRLIGCFYDMLHSWV